MSGKLVVVPKAGPWRTAGPAEVVIAAAEALGRSGKGRDDPVDQAIRSAEGDLRLFGPMLRALDDRYVDLADKVAVQALPAFGRAALPELRAAYDPKGKAGDGRRVMVISLIDPRAGRVLCRAALAGGSPAGKSAALYTLPRVDPAEARRSAAAAAADPNESVRVAAMKALEAVGPTPAEIPTLVRAVMDGEWTEGWLARGMLEAIGRPAIPALLPLLDAPVTDHRRYANWSLRTNGPAAAAAVPALRRLLNDPDPYIPRDAAHTLGCIGPAARDAQADLAARMTPGWPMILRVEAAIALWKITRDAGRSVPVLREAIDSPDNHPGARRDLEQVLDEMTRGGESCRRS